MTSHCKFILQLLFIPTLLGLAGCKKEEELPSADFTADKSEYVSGDVIQLTNTSVNGVTYRWTMPDGQTSKSANASYATTPSQVDVSLPFRLDAFSKSGNKTDFAVKNITVKAATGQLVLYSSSTFTPSYNLSYTLDNAVPTQYELLKYSATAPCGQPGYKTFTLTIGPHVLSYRAGNGGNFSAITVTIMPDQCTARDCR